jgi:hypothetical protein
MADGLLLKTQNQNAQRFLMEGKMWYNISCNFYKNKLGIDRWDRFL